MKCNAYQDRRHLRDGSHKMVVCVHQSLFDTLSSIRMFLLVLAAGDIHGVAVEVDDEYILLHPLIHLRDGPLQSVHQMPVGEGEKTPTGELSPNKSAGVNFLEARLPDFSA